MFTNQAIPEALFKETNESAMIIDENAQGLELCHVNRMSENGETESGFSGAPTETRVPSSFSKPKYAPMSRSAEETVLIIRSKVLAYAWNALVSFVATK